MSNPYIFSENYPDLDIGDFNVEKAYEMGVDAGWNSKNSKSNKESTMDNLKSGDIIVAHGAREQVVERLGTLVWTRQLLEAGAVSNIQAAQDIEDLKTFGWTVKNGDE